MENEKEFMKQVQTYLNDDNFEGAVEYVVENGAKEICTEFVNNVKHTLDFIATQEGEVKSDGQVESDEQDSPAVEVEESSTEESPVENKE